MRKRNMAIIVILISVALFLLIGCVSIRPTETGPLVIAVTDNETGMPLSGITVYYRLRKVRPIFFIENRYINIELQKLKTDRNGEITIPAKRYFLRLTEDILSRNIYINLDTKDNKMLGDKGTDTYFHSLFFRNERDDVILVDSNYYATAVVIFNFKEKKEETDFRNGFFWHHIETPFDEKEMRISVKLARNIDGIDGINEF